MNRALLVLLLLVSFSLPLGCASTGSHRPGGAAPLLTPAPLVKPQDDLAVFEGALHQARMDIGTLGREVERLKARLAALRPAPKVRR